MFQNPFTPVFGNEPMILAGREQLINDVLRGLNNGIGDPNRITIFTGPRGSGKTVLLAKIATEAESMGWISVHAPATQGMLNELIEQLEIKAQEFLPAKSKNKLTGIQVSGFGFTKENLPEEKPSWRTQMGRYLDVLQEQGVGLLFTLDEVSAEVSEVVQFVSTFQVFIMEKRDVALMMAGLPDKVTQMFNSDSISFLRRAFKRKLGAIGLPDVRSAMKRTIEISGRTIGVNALGKLAESTGGFPFLIQLIGYHVYNQSNTEQISLADVEIGIDAAQEDMESMVLDATLYGLSAVDIRFLEAMTQDANESSMSDIAERLGVSVNYAGAYRRRMVEQGIVAPAGRGKLVFSVPMLKTLLKERIG